MRFRSRPHEVRAFRFDGTEASAEAARGFISENDIENVEVSAQGAPGRLALDVRTDYSIYTIERGDYIYVANGIIHTASARYFEAAYELLSD